MEPKGLLTHSHVPATCPYTKPAQDKDRWVPVTMAWHNLRIQIEEWPPSRSVAVNVLNKQSRIADKGWSSSLGVGQVANNSSL
jgi:hypothetical protein